MQGTAAAVFAKSSLFEQTTPASVEISDIESVVPWHSSPEGCLAGTVMKFSHLRNSSGSCFVVLRCASMWV